MRIEVVTGAGTVVATRTVTADQLYCAPSCEVRGAYALRTPSGDASTTDQAQWTSIATLIRDAGADPARVTYAEVLDATGVSHPVDGARLLPADGDPAGGPDRVPAVATSGSSVAYVRPLQGADDANLTADPDANGYFQTSPAQGQTLVVRAHLTGRWLRPAVTVTPTAPGTRRTLAATLADPPPGLAYAWDLGDGARASGPRVAHTWTARRAPYVVTLVATAPDGSWGRALAVVATGATPTPSPSPTPTASPGPGPSREPSRGPGRAGPAGPQPSAAPGPGTAGRPGDAAPGATSGATSGPVAPTAPSAPSLSARPSASSTPAPTTPAGEPVTGLLLAAEPRAGGLTLPTPPRGSAADVAQPGAAADGRLHLPGWALVIGLVALLYGGALARELRAGRGGRIGRTGRGEA
ncbi:PKD domain-containing protein [Nocardioides sp. TRM66260-LWL]|uniref:PKD domain-containing protein n=1 Tax=Nocardioides sp. TRM66260-LWL TaxID=2874478 RepID=UPI001CC527BE|nr:PKD domain-containing protein [Nocardioides sp. TRM66260-LWL]MBZ5735059.1 PKD domain-containing protein [Nocardioides sp. TRM66260-LWL]